MESLQVDLEYQRLHGLTHAALTGAWLDDFENNFPGALTEAKFVRYADRVVVGPVDLYGRFKRFSPMMHRNLALVLHGRDMALDLGSPTEQHEPLLQYRNGRHPGAPLVDAGKICWDNERTLLVGDLSGDYGCADTDGRERTAQIIQQILGDGWAVEVDHRFM